MLFINYPHCEDHLTFQIKLRVVSDIRIESIFYFSSYNFDYGLYKNFRYFFLIMTVFSNIFSEIETYLCTSLSEKILKNVVLVKINYLKCSHYRFGTQNLVHMSFALK